MNRYSAIASLILTVAASADTLRAQAVLRPAPSTRGVSEVSLTYPAPAAPTPAATPLLIRLDYGQPHLRGRTLHTDSLVPYDKPWRTGANGNTTLTTDVDLMLGGATLAKGTYVLYTVPSRAGWKLVVQRSVGQSPTEYADKDDVARIDLRHTTLPAQLETFSMWLIPSLEPGAARGELRFAWGVNQLSTNWSIK